MTKNALSLSALAAACATFCTCAQAHHGFGQFNVEVDTEYSGTLTKMELVNPHSYMHFETRDASGQKIEMRCEMRAAMLIRRSGWDEDMFVIGSQVAIKGHPHRNDPTACYLESFTLNETTLGRNDQLTRAEPVAAPGERALRLVSGEPNISGDWAVEQNVLTAPPSGGRGDMVPRSLRDEYASGQMTLAEIRALNPTPRPVYTATGQQAADAFDMWSVSDNPRLSCQLTSILYDWTFDWPVNRIAQTTTPEGERVVDIDFGLYNFNRRIHLGVDTHPANIEPSTFGHSTGTWEGDTLIVDTTGFTAGVLAPPTRHSEQLHIVERFTLDPATMALRREYSATDPVYLAEPYAGADTVYLSETPYVYEGCKEMTPEFQPQ